MSDEQNETTAEEPVVEETPKAPRKKVNAHDKAMKSLDSGKDATASEGFRLCCTPKSVGSMFDNDRNIRIPPAGSQDVKASSPIKCGSWLHAQMMAGLIRVMA